MLRTLAICCALTALIQIIFWIGDRMSGLPFHGTMLFFSSIVWGLIFWGVANRSTTPR